MQRKVEGGERLLTLVGPGGVGKTTLARQFWRDWSGTAFFVDLQTASDGSDVLHFTANEILGVVAQPSVEQIGRAIQSAEPILLVLDNAEHVVLATRDLVDGLLQLDPELICVVTSRQRLDSEYETMLTIPPLTIDGGSELYCQLARKRDPAFALQPDDPDLRELVGKLDALPLAIELASARSRVMTPSDISERLQNQAALLRTRTEETVRHDSLNACIAWSVDTLSSDELAAIRQLAVFAGPFTLSDAEIVFDGDWVADAIDGCCA